MRAFFHAGVLWLVLQGGVAWGGEAHPRAAETVSEAPLSIEPSEPVEEVSEPKANVPSPALKKMDNTAAPLPEKASGVSAEPSALELNAIRLQGLNKVIAHLSTLEAPLGTVMRFGTLEILARRCWQSPPDEKPENAALLEIWEHKPGEGPQKIFMGWMFSSSPALSALEHPVYDVTVLACAHMDEPGR